VGNETNTTQYLLIFKTNINCHKDVRCISSLLTTSVGIMKWSVDLTDIDNVLRIESEHSDHSKVISLVANAGYFCEELLD
jgi:hypothetical protein